MLNMLYISFNKINNYIQDVFDIKFQQIVYYYACDMVCLPVAFCKYRI